MSRKKKSTKAQAKDRQWENENRSLQTARRKARHIKATLRRSGFSLPFYDYLDSYEEEFHRIAEWAKAEYPSLLKVHEVEDHIFERPEDHLAPLGYGHLKQIFFNIDNNLSEYGQQSADANISGVMIAFHDWSGAVRSVILLKKSIKTSVQLRELKYAFKIPALCHEIGHVRDLEQGVNFDLKTPTMDVLGAEVFAHLCAFEIMAKRSLRQSFNVLLDALKDAAPKEDGYLSKVAALVLERMPEYTLPDWQEVLDGIMAKK